MSDPFETTEPPGFLSLTDELEPESVPLQVALLTMEVGRLRSLVDWIVAELTKPLEDEEPDA